MGGTVKKMAAASQFAQAFGKLDKDNNPLEQRKTIINAEVARRNTENRKKSPLEAAVPSREEYETAKSNKNRAATQEQRRRLSASTEPLGR